MTLRQKIEQEIREHGPIPFSRYMELCLYDPELGYYSRAAEKFGEGGDFYTSSDVHAVFGRLLARQFEEMWRALGSPAQMKLLELGPGAGCSRKTCSIGRRRNSLISTGHCTTHWWRPRHRCGNDWERCFANGSQRRKSAYFPRKNFLASTFDIRTSRLRRAETPVAPSASRVGSQVCPRPGQPANPPRNLRKSANGKGTASAVPKSPGNLRGL